MRFNDRLLALVLLGLSAFVIWEAMSFPRMAGMAVGPGLFPIVLASALAVAAALLLATTWQTTRSVPAITIDPEVRNTSSVLRALAVFASCALFAGFGQSLGFIIVGILALGMLLLAFGVRWPLAAAITVVLVIGLNLFFVRVMRIPLPLGPLDVFGRWL